MAAHSDSDDDFVPMRRQTSNVRAESGSDSDDDFVPIRAHQSKTGASDDIADLASQISGSAANADEQISQAKNVLADKEKLKSVIHELSKEKGGFESAIETVEGNDNLRRKAMRVSHDPKIRSQVNSMKRKEKLKLQKQYERAQRAAKLPSMSGDGYKSVTINLSGKYKPTIIAGPEFLQSKDYTGWTVLPLKNDIYISFDPTDSGPNKHATKITGQKVGDKHVFYKMMESGQLMDLKVADFATIFPDKKNSSKTATAPAAPTAAAPVARRTSRRGRR
jgi:hypothetical protein